MATYTISTDAVSGEYLAANEDDAARQFAAEEGIAANNLAELVEYHESVGGWCRCLED